jgi:hypothetical protein
MGSILPVDAPRHFDVQIEGSAQLSRVELVRDGHVVRRAEPSGLFLQTQFVDQAQGAHWYLLKVSQADGHRAWSSPIWFEAGGDPG